MLEIYDPYNTVGFFFKAKKSRNLKKRTLEDNI